MTTAMQPLPHATPRPFSPSARDRSHHGLCQHIDQGGIDLWRVDLDQRTPDAWSPLLVSDELARAERFARWDHGERFLQARLALRILLAAYSGLAERDLPIQADIHGKPGLPAALRLGFNLSHAGRHALIAIGRQRGIGVDIECEPPAGDLKALAHQVFSATEWPILSALTGEDLTRTFLLGWTRKEACLKALGTGLLLEPDRINAGLSPLPQRVAAMPDMAPVVVTSVDIGVDEPALPCLAALAVCESGQDRLGAVHCFTFSPYTPWERD